METMHIYFLIHLLSNKAEEKQSHSNDDSHERIHNEYDDSCYNTITETAEEQSILNMFVSEFKGDKKFKLPPSRRVSEY